MSGREEGPTGAWMLTAISMESGSPGREGGEGGRREGGRGTPIYRSL